MPESLSIPFGHNAVIPTTDQQAPHIIIAYGALTRMEKPKEVGKSIGDTTGLFMFQLLSSTINSLLVHDLIDSATV